MFIKREQNSHRGTPVKFKHRMFGNETEAIAHYLQLKDKYMKGARITNPDHVEDLTRFIESFPFAAEIIGPGIHHFTVEARGRGTTIILERTDLTQSLILCREWIKDYTGPVVPSAEVVEVQSVEAVEEPAPEEAAENDETGITYEYVAKIMQGPPYITWKKHYGKSIGTVMLEEPNYPHWMYRKMLESLDDRDRPLFNRLSLLFNRYRDTVMPVINAARQAFHNQMHRTPVGTFSDGSLTKLPPIELVTAPEMLLPAVPVKSKEELMHRAVAIEEEQQQLLHMQAQLLEKQQHLTCEAEQIETDLARIRQEELARRPMVTDHALVRYLERVMHLNLEELREKVLGEGSPELLAAVNTMGDGDYVVSNSHRLRVVDNTVVTVLAA